MGHILDLPDDSSIYFFPIGLHTITLLLDSHIICVAFTRHISSTCWNYLGFFFLNWRASLLLFHFLTYTCHHGNGKHIAFFHWKNCAIRNCWISMIGAIELHPFSTSAKRSKTCVVTGEGGQFYCPSSTYLAIVLFLTIEVIVQPLVYTTLLLCYFSIFRAVSNM